MSAANEESSDESSYEEEPISVWFPNRKRRTLSDLLYLGKLQKQKEREMIEFNKKADEEEMGASDDDDDDDEEEEEKDLKLKKREEESNVVEHTIDGRTHHPLQEQVKFTTIEDVALCQAHIEITGDGSVGVSQGRTKYWDRIVPQFLKKIKDNVNDRDKGSLENRICAIKKDIKLLVGILSKLYRGAKSGWSPGDLMIHARIEFMKVHGRPFQYDECYELYKHQPGYDYTEHVEVPLPPPPTDIQLVDTNNDDVEREVGAGSTNQTNNDETKYQRGPGKKKLKAIKKVKFLGGTSSGSIESQFSESSDKMLAYLKDQEQQIKEENERRKEEKLREREEKIMMTDMSKLSSIGREWVERQQKELIEKWNRQQ